MNLLPEYKYVEEAPTGGIEMKLSTAGRTKYTVSGIGPEGEGMTRTRIYRRYYCWMSEWLDKR